MNTSLNQVSIWFLALAVILTSESSVAQSKRDGIELRLVGNEGGLPYSFSGSQPSTVKLEPLPLLRAGDFVRAEARAAKSSDKASKKSSGFDLEITFSERGKARFNAAAALGRQRRFCIVSAGSLKNCSDFVSSQKDRNDQGLVLSGMDRGESQRLAGSLATAIRSAEAANKAAESATQVATARELLDVLYKRAVRERSPAWISGDEREPFLVRDLVNLWDKVDVAQAAGNGDAVFSSDPVAATNGLMLRAYQIDMEQERPTMAIANVTLRYVGNASQQVVRYILVRERGNWRIADIGNEGESLKGNLQAFLRPPGTPREK